MYVDIKKHFAPGIIPVGFFLQDIRRENDRIFMCRGSSFIDDLDDLTRGFYPERCTREFIKKHSLRPRHLVTCDACGRTSFTYNPSSRRSRQVYAQLKNRLKNQPELLVMRSLPIAWTSLPAFAELGEDLVIPCGTTPFDCPCGIATFYQYVQMRSKPRPKPGPKDPYYHLVWNSITGDISVTIYVLMPDGYIFAHCYRGNVRCKRTSTGADTTHFIRFDTQYKGRSRFTIGSSLDRMPEFLAKKYLYPLAKSFAVAVYKLRYGRKISKRWFQSYMGHHPYSLKVIESTEPIEWEAVNEQLPLFPSWRLPSEQSEVEMATLDRVWQLIKNRET